MNKSEFIELCQLHVRSEDRAYVYIPSSLQQDIPAAFIRVEECGGVSGGSCWDSSDPKPYSTTIADPGIGAALDPFLEANFPAISFLTYRKLMSKVEVSEKSVCEYYGNRTNYSVWKLHFEDVWLVLDESGMLGGS